jgi:DNA-binding transcriptional MerR regulator
VIAGSVIRVRLFDEPALEEMAFVSRAKGIGMSLEDIADLLAAWPTGECRLVQTRLRAFLAGRIGGVRDQLAELHAFLEFPAGNVIPTAEAPGTPGLLGALFPAGDAPGCQRTTGLALLAAVALSRGQSAVPGQQRRRRHAEDLCPAPAGEEPRQRGETQPVSRVVPDPADVTAHRVPVPEHQQLSSRRPVAAEHQDSYAYPACQQVDDLEQHLASKPSPRQACW